eukprot:2963973-Karenia_brevis.AAC.1
MITYGILGTQTQQASTESELTEASETINKTHPDLIMSYLDSHCGPSDELKQYLDGLQGTAAAGQTVVHFAEQFPGNHRNAWKCDELPWYDGR